MRLEMLAASCQRKIKRGRKLSPPPDSFPLPSPLNENPQIRRHLKTHLNTFLQQIMNVDKQYKA